MNERLQYIYQNVLQKVMQTPESWKQFLGFASTFYKYSFSKALLVYAQNSNVTMLATYDGWKKVGRAVTRGSKSIAVRDFTGQSLKLQHLFDISQTHGQPVNVRWELTDNIKPVLLKKMNEQNGRNDFELDAAVFELVRKNIRENLDGYLEELQPNMKKQPYFDLPPEALRQDLSNIMTDSVGYLVFRRCGLPDSYFRDENCFQNISQYKNPALASLLGYAVTNTSKNILQSIEQSIKTERGLKNDQRTELQREGRTLPSRSADGGQRSLGTLRTAGSQISARGTSGEIYGDGNGRVSYVHHAERGQGSDGKVGNTDTGNAENESRAADGRHLGENTTHEHDKVGGRGNNTEGHRPDTEVNEQAASKKESSKDGSFISPGNKDAAYPVLTEEQLIERALQHGSGTEGGKERIYEYFLLNESNRDRAKFLKKEYGYYGCSTSNYSLDSRNNGLIYSYKTDKCDIRGKMTWTEVANRIDRLIADGSYIQEKPPRHKTGEQVTFKNFISAPSVSNNNSVSETEQLSFENIVQEKTNSESSSAANMSNTINKTDSNIIYEQKGSTLTIRFANNQFPSRDVTIPDDTSMREYLKVKQLYPDTIVAYQTGDCYFIFNNDTEQAVKLLKSRLFDFEVSDFGKVKASIFPANEWIFHSNRLWSKGCNVLLYALNPSGNGHYISKLLKSSDFIPIGTKFQDKEGQFVVEKVDFEKDTVMLRNTASKAISEETTAYVRDIVEHELGQFQYPRNYQYNAADHLYDGGPKVKYHNNIDAIKLLKRLELEDRTASADEQKSLARYVGWGGLANAFNPDAADWKKEYVELKGLLSDNEYTNARASTITAYYTDPEIIKNIFGTVERFGLKGGRILDPAMGTGNFFSAIPEDLSGSQLYGVELDTLTGRIAKKLYPNANIKITGFENTKFQDNFFDLAIGNIPFNNYSVNDERYSAQHFLIHDYFIAKSIDKIRPGGIIAFITSKGTMDKQDSKVRRYISQRADLIGAVRLPNNAFKSIAGTEVTTDIIFLQKREHENDRIPDWTQTVFAKDPVTGSEMRINSYFDDHPDMLLGEMRLDKNMYGSDRTTALFPLDGHDLYADLGSALSKLDAHYENRRSTAPEPHQQGEKAKEEIEALPNVKNFTYTVIDGNIYYRENDVMLLHPSSGVKAERIKGMTAIRNALRRVIDIQTEPYEPEVLKNAQQALNTAYDAFVQRHGCINEKANIIAFSDDDDLPLLRSVEDYDKETNSYKKAPVFYKATIRSYVQPEKADTALEALMLSMNIKLGVDLHYMSQLYGKNPNEIINELGNRIFLNPQKYSGNLYDGWEIDEEYLSGDVKVKLEIATTRSKEYPDLFERNVEALEKVQPTPLKASEIDFRISSPWIPIELYQKFMWQTFGTPTYHQGDDGIRIYYNKFTTTWFIENKHAEPDSVKVNKTFGTNRANAYMIYEDCLNQKSTTIRDPDTYIDNDGHERVRYVVNVKETMIARGKQQQIKEAFRSWLFKDKDRADILVKIYNDKFNTIRPRSYDGSNLVFRNMSQDYELRPHQKNVVARILYSGTALMAHEVGAGKTASMIAAGMTLRQSGAIKKPVYVVPNSLVDQWEHEFLRFYPTAHLLVATKKDFEKENRRRFFGKIAAGDYDGIIIPQSSFEKISVSPERQMALVKNEIDGIAEMISSAKEEKQERWSIKQMEIQRKKLEERYKKLTAEKKKDNILYFEQLGIDFMFVDEAHAYKNYFTYTKLTNVAGIGKTSSQRAMDMFLKCQYLQEQHNGRGVVFATGTPISNSMSEMFVMQRFLQPDKLKELGLEMFDNWAAEFGEVVTSLEITPEGSGYRMKSRFAKFYNLPELMNIFREVADIQTADMLKLPCPKIYGGKPKAIVTECSDYQKKKIAQFAERAEAIRDGSVDPRIDNMLKLTLEAKLLSIDPRLLDSNAPNDENSKLNCCIRKIHDIWDRTAADRLTQIVFCDIGVPKGDGKFNVYDEIKNSLVSMGIPEKEVAFIHDAKTDAQRAELFEKVRGGDVRIILGSTQKLGTGTNIQDKLIAAHHLDCPWRPSDNTQRNGRILRYGNNNPSVYIFNYVTKGTFDSYLWQIQEQKLRYITQVMTGKSISRSCEDCDETVLTAAEVKAIATDNPLVSKKMEIDNEVMRLKLIKSNWENEILSLKHNIDTVFPVEIESSKSKIERFKNDIQVAEKNRQENFSIAVGKEIFDDRSKAEEKIIVYSKTLGRNSGDKIKVGQYRGFQFGLERTAFADINLVLFGSNTYSCEMGEYNSRNTTRLDNMIKLFPDELRKEERNLEQNLQQLDDAKAAIVKPFEDEHKLSELIAKQAEIETKLEFNKQDEIVINETENTKEEISMSETEKMQDTLYDAIKSKDTMRVQKLLDNGASVQDMNSGMTPLHCAAQHGADDCAKTLLDRGAYVDALDNNQKTPLYYSVIRDDYVMTKTLLESGANPDLRVGNKKIREIQWPKDIQQLLNSHSKELNRGTDRSLGRV